MCIRRKSVKQEKYPQRNLRTMQINLKPMTTPIHADVKEETSQGSKLFPSPENGCVKSFQRFSNLENHHDFGKHNYALERETFFDKAILSYATKLDKRDTLLSARRRTT